MLSRRRAALVGALAAGGACLAGVAVLEANWEPDDRYEEAVRESEPMSWWRFDELDGDVAEDSAGSNDARYLGLARHGVQGPLTDRIDTGVGFQGDALVVVDGDAFSFPGRRPFSVEAWVTPRPPQPSPFTRVASKERFERGDRRSGWALYFDDVPGTVGFERRAGRRSQAAVGSEVLPDTDYTHIVGAFDGATARLYINGERVADSGSRRPPALPVIDSPLTFGRLWEPSTAQYYGLLDEVAIYDRALSPREVEAHAAAAG